MKMHRRALACGLVALLLAVGGCGGKQHWQTKDITGYMPDLSFTLTSDHGKTVHGSDYAGHVVMLYFGYTHCPDVCPTTLATIARALKKLGARAKDVRVLFVSVDPNRDTPAALRDYTAAFSPQMIGLTGTQDQLRALSKRYRVTYGYGKTYPKGNYTVSHSSAIFVFDRKGRVRLLMQEQNGAKAMAADLSRLLG